MGDQSERFVNAITELDEIADAVPRDEALDHFDSATLQLFWRDWPHISSWAGAVWRTLNEDLSEPATPPSDPDLDETGAAG